MLTIRWRPAALLLLASRDWRVPLLAWGAAIPLAALAARGRTDFGMTVLLVTPPLTALTIVGALFAQVRRPAVWGTMFSRAGSGPSDLWRASGLAGSVYVGVTATVGTATVLGLRAAAPLDAGDVARIVTFAAAWTTVCALAATVVAATVRRGATGVLLLWMALPALLRALGVGEDVRRVLEVLAPPLEASVRLHAAWRGELPDLAPWFALQLAGFLAIGIALLGVRYRRIAQAPDAVE